MEAEGLMQPKGCGLPNFAKEVLVVVVVMNERTAVHSSAMLDIYGGRGRK